MKAVVNGITEEELAQRRRRGQDYFDEMWEGVLHMAPMAAMDHQGMVTALVAILKAYCDRHALGEIFVPSNVRDPAAGDRDYRVPDIVFVAAAHAGIIGKVYVEGGPDVVIEVRSPDDETYEKIPFYEKIGTGWLIVVNPEGTMLEVFRLVGGRFIQQAADAQGWIRCEPLETAWRSADALFLRLERDGQEVRVR